MTIHPITGEIWENEHGPKGGDEINIIKKGVNYGWPEITYGINYSGTPITNKTEDPQWRSLFIIGFHQSPQVEWHFQHLIYIMIGKVAFL